MLRPLSLPVTARCLQIRPSTRASVNPASSRVRGGEGRKVSSVSRAEMEPRLSLVGVEVIRFNRRGNRGNLPWKTPRLRGGPQSDVLPEQGMQEIGSERCERTDRVTERPRPCQQQI